MQITLIKAKRGQQSYTWLAELLTRSHQEYQSDSDKWSGSWARVADIGLVPEDLILSMVQGLPSKCSAIEKSRPRTYCLGQDKCDKGARYWAGCRTIFPWLIYSPKYNNITFFRTSYIWTFPQSVLYVSHDSHNKHLLLS